MTTDGAGALTLVSLTDGTTTLTAGGLSGLDSLTVTNTVQGGSIADGTVSLADDGTITGVTSMMLHRFIRWVWKFDRRCNFESFNIGMFGFGFW